MGGANPISMVAELTKQQQTSGWCPAANGIKQSASCNTHPVTKVCQPRPTGQPQLTLTSTAQLVPSHLPHTSTWPDTQHEPPLSNTEPAGQHSPDTFSKPLPQHLSCRSIKPLHLAAISQNCPCQPSLQSQPAGPQLPWPLQFRVAELSRELSGCGGRQAVLPTSDQHTAELAGCGELQVSLPAVTTCPVLSTQDTTLLLRPNALSPLHTLQGPACNAATKRKNNRC